MKKIFFALLILVSVIYSRDISLCGIRVEFEKEDNDAITGNGKFLMDEKPNQEDIFKDTRLIDPAPHDKNYFMDHIKSLSNYYTQVSNGNLNISVENSQIYPKENNSVYQLDTVMSYYHPTFKADSVVDKRLTQLIKNSIEKADQDVNFSNYDLVVIFHAGIGQIYNISMDPTPKDIKSAYMNEEDFARRLGLKNGIPVNDEKKYVNKAIVLPETQNNFLFDNWQKVFGKKNNPEKYYQFGLNGTFAMMFGYYLGLPSLGDTTGKAGAGRFGLMDQGSANLHSLIPSPPSAWSRMVLGWEDPVEIKSDTKVNLSEAGNEGDTTLIKVPINNDEYFLVENRNNFYNKNNNIDTLIMREYHSHISDWNDKDVNPPSLPYIDEDIGAKYSSNGVLVSVPDYDYGIPGSGLLIWHIDKSKIKENLNTVINVQDSLYVNLSRENRGVDLEEGDGGQNFGYESSILTRQYEYGEEWDPWFAGNELFYERNPGSRYSSEDSTVGFTPNTNPSTNSNMNSYSGIYIDSIGRPGQNMEFQVAWKGRENKEKINLELSENFSVQALISSHMKDTFSVIAGDSLVVIGQNGEVITSAQTEGYNQNEKLKLLHDSKENRLFILYEKEGRVEIQKWNINLSAPKIKYVNKLKLSQTNFSSNPVLFQNNIGVGITSNGKNYLLEINIDDLKDYNKHNMKERLQALSGGENSLYYLSDGKIGQYNLKNSTNQTIVQSDKIGGERLLQGELNNSKEDISDFVFTKNNKIGVVIDKGDKISTRKLSTYTKSILSDIDGDSKVEIVSALQNGKVLSFNSLLKLENNFPYKIDHKITSFPLTVDINGDDKQDVVVEDVKGNIYSFSSTGKKLSQFPLTSKNSDAEYKTLFSSNNGTVLLSINKEGKIDNNYITEQTITERSWFTQGGNNKNSNFISGYERVEEDDDKSLLNKNRTYNWPNPVKGENETRLRYYLNSHAKNIEIKIYDLAGNLVKKIRDDSPIAEEANEISWNVSDIESGAYFAVVKANAENSTDKKIIKIMIIK